MENKTVPYIAFESELARMERIIKRLCIILAVLVVLLVGSNGAWLWYESQFSKQVTTTTVEADATDGGNAVVNGSGEVNINGTRESN